MEKIILSTANPDERRIAVLNNGIISDYISLIPGYEDRKGSIYRGVIDVVEPSLEACFVDIGDDKKGFLQFSEIHESYLTAGNGNMVERLKPGTPLLVSIVKDSRSEKGPLLTTRIDLSNGDLVLMPFSRDKATMVRISRQADDLERERLEKGKDSLGLPDGMTLIIRSKGVGKPLDDLKWELNSYLLPLYNKIKEVFGKLDTPALIYEDHNIVNTCLREFFTPHTLELVCDQEETMQEAKESIGVLMGGMVDRVRMVNEGETLFDQRLQEQLDALMSRKITLPSGGELVIDVTEALIAIDVNSKRSRQQSGIEKTAFQTNLEAANETARQLRLRNLAGLIVIDFIDMEEDKNKRALEQAMRKNLRSDKARVSVGELSRFGLLEMTRQNIGRALHESHAEVCKYCQGTGHLATVSSFARTMLDKIRQTCISRRQTGTVILQLPSKPATYLLNEQRMQLVELQDDMGIKLTILPDYSMQIPDHRMRFDKTHTGKIPDSKVSFTMDANVNLEKESYLGDIRKQRKHNPAAISSFKVATHDKRTAATSDQDEITVPGLLARVTKFFVGKDSSPPAQPSQPSRRQQSHRPKNSNKRSIRGGKQESHVSRSENGADSQVKKQGSRTRRRGKKPFHDSPANSHQGSRQIPDKASDSKKNHHERATSTAKPGSKQPDKQPVTDKDTAQKLPGNHSPLGSPPAATKAASNKDTPAQQKRQSSGRDPGNSLRKTNPNPTPTTSYPPT